ncbi:substrate-binding periplasmic protein [Chromobacterium phragmitis]|uniref:Amino acid ABC transporter substrate-binding protein n=1 Tax=Chromobacterium phragmitis TaxID=2202141 RepID=A0A344UDA1_9NEIS|nr:transporter substrate-binding domain-containing protein [Chromobacterium phragmitis]AXE33249.1 amino acid ABC transporter substrate-binding protein [Chromobacterium phragmitis]
MSGTLCRIWLILACALPQLVWAAEPAQTIALANGEWAPYLSASLPDKGYASHIVSEAFHRAGIQTRYDFYPWARAEAMVKSGEIAGSVVWSITPERQQFALFSDPVVSDEEVVFHLASRKMAAEKVDDFDGLTMATPNGSRLGIWQEAIAAGRIRSYVTKDIQSGMRQLLLGRLDFFPLIRSVGLSELRRHFTPREQAAIVAAPHVFVRTDYRLMLSRKQPGAEQLLQRFNQGLAALRASGEYRRMERGFLAGRYDPLQLP